MCVIVGNKTVDILNLNFYTLILSYGYEFNNILYYVIIIICYCALKTFSVARAY